MSKALILGCSHASGAEMFDHIDQDYSKGFFNSYPAQIASGLGYEIENRSISGGSNDAMFRIFEHHQKDLTEDDIVIACWTGSERTEVYSKEDQCWITYCSGVDTFYKNQMLHFFDPHKVKDQALYRELLKQWVTYDSDCWKWRINKIKNMCALNTIAGMRGITVYNIHSFNAIDDTDKYDVYGFNWPVHNVEFCKWASENNYLHTDLGHFYLDAHTAFANYVLQSIKEHNGI